MNCLREFLDINKFYLVRTFKRNQKSEMCPLTSQLLHADVPWMCSVRRCRTCRQKRREAQSLAPLTAALNPIRPTECFMARLFIERALATNKSSKEFSDASRQFQNAASALFNVHAACCACETHFDFEDNQIFNKAHPTA